MAYKGGQDADIKIQNLDEKKLRKMHLSVTDSPGILGKRQSKFSQQKEILKRKTGGTLRKSTETRSKGCGPEWGILDCSLG